MREISIDRIREGTGTKRMPAYTTAMWPHICLQSLFWRRIQTARVRELFFTSKAKVRRKIKDEGYQLVKLILEFSACLSQELQIVLLLWKAVLSPRNIFMWTILFDENEIKKTFIESESGVFIGLRMYQYSTARVSFQNFSDTVLFETIYINKI